MNTQVLVRGLAAGFVGATVIAVFFFVTDLIAGTPLATPGFMAEALLDAPGAAGVPAYTVLHYTSFLIMGMAAAWALDNVRTDAPILIGLALGGMLFAFIFYGAVLFSGPRVVQLLGWPVALVANLLAGLAMVFTIRRGSGEKKLWNDRLLEIPWLREGLWLGLSTSALVAVWMVLVDTVAGEPLFTAGALGSAMILGAAEVAQIEVNAATVLGYGLYHFAIFTSIGVAVAFGASRAESAPPVVIAALLLFAVFEALTVGLIAIMAAFLLGATAWWGLLGGNLLAASWLAWNVSRRHPALAELLGRTELSSETP